MTSTASTKRIIIVSVLLLAIAGIAAAAALQYYTREVKGKAVLPVLGEVMDFEFENYDGTKVTRASMLGKVWVVDFIFTTCGGLCPLMTTAMGQVQQGVRAIGGLDATSLRLVSVTTDPEVDTKERLRAYAETHEARPELWYFLRGPFADVQRFSQDALKLSLERATKEQVSAGAEKVMHSDRFVLIDRRGRIRGFYGGTRPDEVRELIQAIPRLVAE